VLGLAYQWRERDHSNLPNILIRLDSRKSSEYNFYCEWNESDEKHVRYSVVRIACICKGIVDGVFYEEFGCSVG
jgi:hypothetical protein